MKKEIKKVALLGLGAMGAMYAVSIFNKIGDGFDVLVDEKRKARYQKEGININGKEYHFRYITPSEAKDDYDLVIILVKYSALAEAISMIKPCVGEDTIILSLLNGVDSEEHLRKVYGTKRVPRSFIQGSATKEGRFVTFEELGQIIYGYDGFSNEENQKDENIDALSRLFCACGIPNRISFDIVYEQWYKFMTNIAMNIPAAILQAKYRVFRENDRMISIMQEICYEVIGVANRCGVPLSCKDVQRLTDHLCEFPMEGKASTMQDVEAKRKTEVDMFCQTIVDLGIKHHVPTPYNRMMLDFVKIIEEMYEMK